MRTVVVATHNAKKAVELRRVLEAEAVPVRVMGLGDLPAYPEPAETETTFEGNALLKAHAAARQFGLLAVGRGGCRWELASTPEDVAFLRDVVDAALEGRVSEVFGPARSQVTVPLPDGRLVRTAQSRFPRGCLPVPRWRQTTSNRMDYTPYS